MLRVVVGWQTNLNPHATNAQQTDYNLMVVLQQTARLRVVAKPSPM